MPLLSIGLVRLNADGSAKLDSKGEQICIYSAGSCHRICGHAYRLEFRPRQPVGDSPGDRPGVHRAADGQHSHVFQHRRRTEHGHPCRRRPPGGAGCCAVQPSQQRAAVHRPATDPAPGCSNPNPSCVARISAAFDNNGTGVRGCIRAVIDALLLDPEQGRRQPEPANGKLREPIVHFVPWTHTFHLTAPPGKWNIPDPSDPAGRRGQSPLHAPSVFNFFAPNIVPSIGLWATTASARQSFTSATGPRSGVISVYGWHLSSTASSIRMKLRTHDQPPAPLAVWIDHIHRTGNILYIPSPSI